MEKKTLNFNKSTIAQLNNFEQSNINGAAITGFCHNSSPDNVSCPESCVYTKLCSKLVCPQTRECPTNLYMAC
ncbi:MAG: class I lanthipeptide [Hyphomicrobiales bacterium]